MAHTLETIQMGLFLLLAGLLIRAAYTDLKNRHISNSLCMAVCGVFGLLALVQMLAGISWQSALLWPIAAGMVIFLLCAGLFALGMMGGGDVKLLSAVALIAGPTLGFSFLLYVALAGGLVALGTLLYARLQQGGSTIAAKVPYGIAIAASGLWVCFQRFSEITV